MGGFDYARVELTGVPGLDLALDVLDGDGKRLLTVNDGGAGRAGGDPQRRRRCRRTPTICACTRRGRRKGDAEHAYELTVQTWKAVGRRRARAERRRGARDADHAVERDERRRQRLLRAQARRGLAEPVARRRAGQGRARDAAPRAGAGDGRGAVAQGDRRPTARRCSPRRAAPRTTSCGCATSASTRRPARC